MKRSDSTDISQHVNSNQVVNGSDEFQEFMRHKISAVSRRGDWLEDRDLVKAPGYWVPFSVVDREDNVFK